MKNKVPHIYTASGWFNENDTRILTRMEDYVVYLADKGLCTYHRPRKDGIELKPGEFHDPNLRKKVFTDNVVNIDKADIVYANLSTLSGDRLDTGTVWEVGYALAKGKLVLIVDDGVEYCDRLFGLFRGLLNREFVYVTKSLDISEHMLNELLSIPNENRVWMKDHDTSTTSDRKFYKDIPVAILPDDIDISQNIEDTVSEVYTNYRLIYNIRALSDVSSIFREMEKYGYTIIDTTHRVSLYIMLMGMAYAESIPVISYSSEGSNVNLMLACSTNYHAVGTDDLRSVLSKIHKTGIDSISFDNSNLKVY